MLPSYPLVLASASADGAALANTTTATSIMPASSIPTIPGGTLQIGSLLKVLLRGRISTLTAAPGTLTLDLRLGAVVISAFGAISLNTTAQTNASWEAELLAVIRALGTGTNANALCTGRFTSRALVGSAAVAAGGNGVIVLPDTAPAVGTGFDSSAAQAVNVFGTWSIASSSNSILVHQALVELKI
jgi:hypothetical protein